MAHTTAPRRPRDPGLPDDWGCWYNTCWRCGARYHMSEGGCDACADLDDDAAEQLRERGAYDAEQRAEHERDLDLEYSADHLDAEVSW